MAPVTILIGGGAEKNFHSKIANGEFYDAHQIAVSLINRYISKGRDTEAVLLCERFGKAFINAQQYALAAGIGILLTKVLREFELPPTEDRINLILALFNPTPISLEEDRYKFIESALKWAHDESPSEINEHVRRLHEAAGCAYLADDNFGLSQGHFVQIGQVPDLVALLRKWKERCCPSEKELLVLRLTLILLGKGDVDIADKLLSDPVLGISLDNPHLPPPLQFAYLIVEACKAKSLAFFDAINTKYSLVIRRDPNFSRLTSLIKANYFGRGNPEDGNFVNILSSLFK